MPVNFGHATDQVGGEVTPTPHSLTLGRSVLSCLAFRGGVRHQWNGLFNSRVSHRPPHSGMQDGVGTEAQFRLPILFVMDVEGTAAFFLAGVSAFHFVLYFLVCISAPASSGSRQQRLPVFPPTLPWEKIT